jgi:hypothetical protein
MAGSVAPGYIIIWNFGKSEIWKVYRTKDFIFPKFQFSNAT